MFRGARKKKHNKKKNKTGNGLAGGCQLFNRKIYGYFLQCLTYAEFWGVDVNMVKDSNNLETVNVKPQQRSVNLERQPVPNGTILPLVRRRQKFRRQSETESVLVYTGSDSMVWSVITTCK